MNTSVGESKFQLRISTPMELGAASVGTRIHRENISSYPSWRPLPYSNDGRVVIAEIQEEMRSRPGVSLQLLRSVVTTGRITILVLSVALQNKALWGETIPALADVAERQKASTAQTNDSSHNIIPTRSHTPFTLSRCTSGKSFLASMLVDNPALFVLARALSTRLFCLP